MQAITRRLAVLTLAVCAPLLACKGGDSGLTYKAGGEEQKLELKSAAYYSSTMTYSGGGSMTKGLSVTVNAANYALDTSSGMRSMGKDVADGQTRILISLIGKEGSAGKESTEPPPAGKYSPTADKFMKVRSATIYTFEGGKQKSTSLSSSKLQGSVEVESSADKKFTAKVDLTDGTNTIKGSFEAKAWK